MKKMSLSLLAAGAMAVAGLAHADGIAYPGSLSSEVTSSDTTVLGAGPVVQYEYVYVQPSINWDRSVAAAQLHRNYHLTHRSDSQVRHQAAATFDVPARAGEASTMTGGAPNAVTSNQSMVVGSYTIPYHAVAVDGPYYVFSY